MSLQEKALKLKLEGALAIKHALFWENAIATRGAPAAEAFYKSLGLNHIEVKGYEWEGLTLSREPTPAEKLCVKGIAGAQESSKEKIGKILLELRTQLISDGLEGIKKLEPATYHELTLQASTEIRTSLRDRLIKVYRQGRSLVAAELGKKAAGDDEDEFDDLDTLTDLADTRVINDTQSRIASAAARFAALGLAGGVLMTAIEKEMADGSVSYIDRTSSATANRVINIGRGDEARSRSDEWERIEYSAILDSGTCPACLSEDGKEADSEADLQPVPNPECPGECRCFWIYVAEGNM